MHVLDELHVYDDGDRRSATMNMAVDEALLAFATKPSLRFYRWRRPSLSFGYFGAFSDVAAHAGQRDLVRRWTGGGIVLHDDDLTYSLILPRADATLPHTPRIIYSQVHGAIQQALSGRLDVALATRAAPKVSESCFANAVEADVLLDGRKIAGAAQRRTRAGLLQQGSIQHAALPVDFKVAFASALCANSQPTAITSEILQRAAEIAEHRYATDTWLRMR
jgi:lipoate-protein ligase A